jgi:predicted  nucleic acid-binding Zn-ribbon protein
MSEATNGHARFEDLRSNVGTYIEKVHTLEVEVARMSECLHHIENKIDNLQVSLSKIKENEDPKSLREKVNTWVQLVTVVLVLVSMVLPHIK